MSSLGPRVPTVLNNPEFMPSNKPLLLVLEGMNDFHFVVAISKCLGSHFDLSDAVVSGKVIFAPLGGGDPASWPARFARLGLKEVHIYDREAGAEVELRRQAIARVNLRPGCRGFMTGKRSLENYLHPQAIQAAGGTRLEFGDDDCIPRLLVAQSYTSLPAGQSGALPPYRTQRRAIARAKRWLNTVAVNYMSAELLSARDSAREITAWFTAINDLLATP